MIAFPALFVPVMTAFPAIFEPAMTAFPAFLVNLAAPLANPDAIARGVGKNDVGSVIEI